MHKKIMQETSEQITKAAEDEAKALFKKAQGLYWALIEAGFIYQRPKMVAQNTREEFLFLHYRELSEQGKSALENCASTLARANKLHENTTQSIIDFNLGKELFAACNGRNHEELAKQRNLTVKQVIRLISFYFEQRNHVAKGTLQ